MKTLKATLRDEARARRVVLAGDSAAFAERIAQFADRLAGLADGVIAGYLPLGDEADPRQLMERLAQMGRGLALPCVVARGRPLVFRRWTFRDPTVANAYGILEPEAQSQEVVPTIVLVPLLAFDRLGHRLGYGGGFYDRTLDALRRNGMVIAVGVALAGQEVHELPRETHDHTIDMAITETGIRTFG
jgi:5-formyltetrahydrofolate cyclo-ligase